MFRICSTCQLQRKPAAQATHVATSASNERWFECASHEPHEHAELLGRDANEGQRVELLPVSEWAERQRLGKTPEFTPPEPIVAVEDDSEDGDPNASGPCLGDEDDEDDTGDPEDDDDSDDEAPDSEP